MKVYIESNSCTRRNAELAAIREYLNLNGYTVTNSPKKADYIILNTCALKKEEEDESISRITALKDYPAKLVVTGCLPDIAPSRFKDFSDLAYVTPRNIEKLDAHFENVTYKFSQIKGLSQKPDYKNPNSLHASISKLTRQFEFSSDFFLKATKHLVKRIKAALGLTQKCLTLYICRGCLGECSFCAIKRAIGRIKSELPELIIDQFEQGVMAGYRNFVLLGDDVGAYGRDRNNTLPEILSRLIDKSKELFAEMSPKFNGEEKIGFHIEELSPKWLLLYREQMLEILASRLIKGMICPVQSGSDRILTLMNRYNNSNNIVRFFVKLRTINPEIRLQSHILVGFPSETQEDFNETLNFFNKTNFDDVIIFPYHEKENIPAVNIYPKIPDHIIKERVGKAQKYFKNMGMHVYTRVLAFYNVIIAARCFIMPTIDMTAKINSLMEVISMSAELISKNGNEVTVQFTVKLTGAMLNDEQALQQSLNEAGQVAMKPMLEQFDTNGEPIRINGIKHTVRDRLPQTYETPYGPVKVQRNSYQTSKGGRSYVPLEIDGRMVLNSTPRYAQIVSGKYARFGADAICEDLLECNGRNLSRNYARKLSDFVGSIAGCYESEWDYDLPSFDEPVHSISLGLDGTCMLMHKDGWRETMCGSIAFYDKQGERLYTIYCSATPEYGKEKFKAKLSREIQRVKEKYPDVLYVGLADGAKDNWTFLSAYSKRLLLDFYHAREYISKAASAIFGRDIKGKVAWVDDWSSRLKHKQGSPGRFLKELEIQRASLDKKNFIERDEEIRQVITYYKNHKDKMSYSSYLKNNLAIGSGVTEAACKVLIKQRMCISGSRWKDEGASCVLALRSLKLTKGRWQQFWAYTMRHGCTLN